MFAYMNRKYYDFNVRVCAIRETFEEINLLIVKPLNQKSTNFIKDEKLREKYISQYKSNFLEFCKDQKIIPDFE